MSDATATPLFPLPLTTFEKYMYRDDCAEYPMVFALQVQLTGEIRRFPFQSAFEEVLSRHPLLRASIGCCWRKGLVWEFDAGRRPAFDWNRKGVPLGNCRGEGIDLHGEPGLRCWVREGDGDADVTLQFHHACCDGLGACHFLVDLLAAYAQKTATEAECLPLCDCDLAALRRRGEEVPRPVMPKEHVHPLGAGIRDIVRFLVRRSAVLAPRGTVQNPEEQDPDLSAEVRETSRSTAGRLVTCPTDSIPFLGIFSQEFDRSETARLREACDRQGVTVNDILLRDLFECLQAWLAEQPGKANRWIRIAVPVNLRNGDGEDWSAANCVSYNLLTRDRHREEDAADLLQGIRRENRPFLRIRRSRMFLRGVRNFSHIAGAASFVRGSKRCFATAVLSNLGDINRLFGASFACRDGKFAVGNLLLESIVGAPPVRENTRASFMVLRYAGRLRFCLRCDPQIFTAHEARRLLARYVERVRRSLVADRGS